MRLLGRWAAILKVERIVERCASERSDSVLKPPKPFCALALRPAPASPSATADPLGTETQQRKKVGQIDEAFSLPPLGVSQWLSSGPSH